MRYADQLLTTLRSGPDCSISSHTPETANSQSRLQTSAQLSWRSSSDHVWTAAVCLPLHQAARLVPATEHSPSKAKDQEFRKLLPVPNLFLPIHPCRGGLLRRAAISETAAHQRTTLAYADSPINVFALHLIRDFRSRVQASAACKASKRVSSRAYIGCAAQLRCQLGVGKACKRSVRQVYGQKAAATEALEGQAGESRFGSALFGHSRCYGSRVNLPSITKDPICYSYADSDLLATRSTVKPPRAQMTLQIAKQSHA